MKFIHTADIHLDSPMRGLEGYDGAPVDELRGATRRALENLVELAIDQEVAFVLIAGDVYDGEWKDVNTGLYFARQIARLGEAAIKVIVIAGNHDADSIIARRLPLPECCIELPTDAPATHRLEEHGVAVHGQGFRTRAVVEDLSSAYPDPVPGLLNIGLLHTSADGRPGHANYAPCTLAGLLAKGYDYWALGHVHQREILNERPWVVFPGNIQGRQIREPGRKGATLVTVDDGEITNVEHRDLDVASWVVCAVDAEPLADEADVLMAIDAGLQEALRDAAGSLLVARILVTGPSAAHGALVSNEGGLAAAVRARAFDISADRLWIEKVKVETRSLIDLDEVRGREDAVGELLRSVAALDDARLAELSRHFADLNAKLPHELRNSDEPFDPTDVDTLRSIIGDIEQLLLPRLTEKVE
jgi:DNA repair exonuclease SbcCD nuclease subunit